MKLYYSPGACSLASHIALLEAGLDFELERVDLKSKLTETGADFTAINTKGYVPALVIDSGDIVTENIAVLDWIASQSPDLGLDGPLGRTQLLRRWLTSPRRSTRASSRTYTGASEEDKAKAGMYINKRLRWLADRKVGKYLFGNEPTVADFYLFVTLRWAAKFNIAIPEALARTATANDGAAQSACGHRVRRNACEADREHVMTWRANGATFYPHPVSPLVPLWSCAFSTSTRRSSVHPGEASSMACAPTQVLRRCSKPSSQSTSRTSPLCGMPASR